jgi:hypothetical protein
MLRGKAFDDLFLASHLHCNRGCHSPGQDNSIGRKCPASAHDANGLLESAKLELEDVARRLGNAAWVGVNFVIHDRKVQICNASPITDRVAPAPK